MKLQRSANYSGIANYVVIHLGAVLCFFVEPEAGAMTMAIGLYLLTGLGWSVGIHRGLIHGSFKTYRVLENGFALLGAISGLGGPISSAKTHFLRDYCQSRHGIAGSDIYHSFWRNYLCLPFFCNARLVPAPDDEVSIRLRERAFFRLLEHRWCLFGVVAIGLYGLGGISYVVWGLFVRNAATANVFACFDYFCHSTRHGRQRYKLEGASNEGRNHWLVALLTFGEGWHNNHHAMPNSARMGLARFEVDFGYEAIRIMQWLRLVWGVTAPHACLKSNAAPIDSARGMKRVTVDRSQPAYDKPRQLEG